MTIKRITCIVCVVCLITAAAFSATAVYGSGSGDMEKYTDEAIEYCVKNAGAKDVRDYINGYLTENAGALSEWMIISLARSGTKYDFSSYVGSLNKFVRNNKVESASKRLLYSLAFLCCGDTDNGYIKSSVNDSIGELGIMSLIYGLHLLNNGYVSDKFAVSSVIDSLLSMRLTDGGWALFGTVSDVDVSAMTVQALAPYYRSSAEVKKAVDEAMSLLSERQLDDGSYKGFGKENCESTAQVAIAMASLGISRNDKRFIKNNKNIIDGILKFRLENNSYCHIIDGGYNFMATVQAIMAYISFERAENGKSAFYSIRKAGVPAVTTTTAAETSSEVTAATVPAKPTETIVQTKPSSVPVTTVKRTAAPTEKETRASSTAISSAVSEATLFTSSVTSVSETERIASSVIATQTDILSTAPSTALISSESGGYSESAARITSSEGILSGTDDAGEGGKKGNALTVIIIVSSAAMIAAAAGYIILKKKKTA